MYYDYNEPLAISDKLAANSFDLVVADPPHLSQECMEKTVASVKYLAKDHVLFCTGLCSSQLPSGAF